MRFGFTSPFCHWLYLSAIQDRKPRLDHPQRFNCRQHGLGGFSVYSATKAAVRSFSRSWTDELKRQKIRVNTLSPGLIDTPIIGKGGRTEVQIEEFKATMTTRIPLGRIGDSDEIAKAVLFLASDESSFVTGIELTVDGGQNQV